MGADRTEVTAEVEEEEGFKKKLEDDGSTTTGHELYEACAFAEMEARREGEMGIIPFRKDIKLSFSSSLSLIFISPLFPPSFLLFCEVILVTCLLSEVLFICLFVLRRKICPAHFSLHQVCRGRQVYGDNL